MIALAFDGPIPGRATSSSCVAVLRFTPSAATSGAAVATIAAITAIVAHLRNVFLMPFSPFPRSRGNGLEAEKEHAACRRISPLRRAFQGARQRTDETRGYELGARPRA